ncbi:MAG: glutathione S-transferase N-terminal domain-containing protein [Gammaproteobacteria bacterium]
MSLVINKRSVMTLYSGSDCPFSHRARIVLGEKNINVDILNVDSANLPEDLIDLNPYHTLPTLVDRELVVYNSQIIMEYLDERFPHPPLMPVDPVSRARARLMLYRIEEDWYNPLSAIHGSKDSATITKKRRILRDSLTASAPLFGQKTFFMSDEFSLVDCSIAPILWRLPHFGIELPPQAKAVHNYAQRIFARDGFQASLSEAEREMRD